MTIHHGGILFWLRRQLCRVGWHAGDGIVRRGWDEGTGWTRVFTRCVYCRRQMDLHIGECLRQGEFADDEFPGAPVYEDDHDYDDEGEPLWTHCEECGGSMDEDDACEDEYGVLLCTACSGIHQPVRRASDGD